MTESVRGAVVLSLIERYLLLLVALGANMVLARLLAPEQIGVYSVSLAVIGIAQALRDLGMGSYLIQAPDLRDAHIRTAFGVTLVVGCLLFIVTLGISGRVAEFYREPRMELTLRISALNFLLLPFNTISLSLLRRAMKFKRLLYIAIVATASGTAVSVALAFAGFGENSLAIGAVTTNLITGIGAWLAREDRRFLRPAFSEWRTVLRFGGQSSLVGVVTSLSMDANDLIVGKILGFQPVAILSRAQGLMSLFNRDLMAAVRNVALPAFAAAHRDQRPLSEPFARSVAMVCVCAWSFYAILSFYALEIVDLLYGHQWHSAAPLVPIFCIAGAFAAINALTPNLLVAIGKIGVLTRLDLILQPARLLLIGVAATYFRTIEACAGAFLLSAFIAMPIFWWQKRSCVPDDMATTWRLARSTGFVTLAVALGPAVHSGLNGWTRTQPLPTWEWLGVTAFSGVVGLIAAVLTKHPLAEDRLVRETLRRLTLRKRARMPEEEN